MKKILFYLCVLLVSSAAFADVKGEMDSLAHQASYIADTFMQQSVELRLGYEYRQAFNSEPQAQRLKQLAQKAEAELDEIGRQQAKIKKQIENYSGEDWDSRFGDSGVWRTLGGDICNTAILKSQADYYNAIASERLEQARILNSALDQLSTLPPDVPNVMLVKADIYALLGKSDASSKKLAGELYRKILAIEKLPDELYYPAAIASLKLDSPLSPAVLDELAAKLARSRCKDNFELNMTLAFLQQRLGSTAILKKTVSRWPRAKAFVGELILSDLAAAAPPHVSDLSKFEAECITAAASQKDGPKYPEVLDAMSRIEKLQTPRLLSAAAEAQLQKAPARAVELFIRASLLPREPNDGVESSSNLARQAASISLNYFKDEPNRCEFARRAVENYFAIAGDAADKQIEYLYCKVLADCGDKSASIRMLQKIAASDNAEFARRAKEDLSAMAISKSELLLERGQLFDAAKILIAVDVNVCRCREHVINLMTRYVEKIDEYADANAPAYTFAELGRRTLDCADGEARPYAISLYVQAAVFAEHGQKDKLAALEKLLDSISEKNLDARIAQARLSSAQGDYEKAAKQWGAICGTLKSQPDEPSQHSYKWWQAKFFELENSSRISGASHAEIVHSIEVLQGSFDQIPLFWDKKLKALAAK